MILGGAEGVGLLFVLFIDMFSYEKTAGCVLMELL
jgi:hypothetical protein